VSGTVSVAGKRRWDSGRGRVRQESARSHGALSRPSPDGGIRALYAIKRSTLQGSEKRVCKVAQFGWENTLRRPARETVPDTVSRDTVSRHDGKSDSHPGGFSLLEMMRVVVSSKLSALSRQLSASLLIYGQPYPRFPLDKRLGTW